MLVLVLVIPETYTSALFAFILKLHIIPDIIETIFEEIFEGFWRSQEIQLILACQCLGRFLSCSEH